MKNTLKTIQTASKVAGILSKIVMICCIVGAFLCLVSIVLLAVGIDAALKLSGINIGSILQNEANLTTAQLYLTISLGALILAANAVVAYFAAKYFKNEQMTGTPFTFDGAKELFRLGALSAIISVASDTVSSIVGSIIESSQQISFDMQINIDGLLGFGIFMIVISYLCKYGAELNAERKKSEINEMSNGNDMTDM